MTVASLTFHAPGEIGQCPYLEGCEGSTGLGCTLPSHMTVASLTFHAPGEIGQCPYLEGCEGGAGLGCTLPSHVTVAILTFHAPGEIGQCLYLEGCEGGAGLGWALPAHVAVASLTSHAHHVRANITTWKDMRAVLVWGVPCQHKWQYLASRLMHTVYHPVFLPGRM
jgi:hypothetical protein